MWFHRFPLSGPLLWEFVNKCVSMCVFLFLLFVSFYLRLLLAWCVCVWVLQRKTKQKIDLRIIIVFAFVQNVCVPVCDHQIYDDIAHEPFSGWIFFIYFRFSFYSEGLDIDFSLFHGHGTRWWSRDSYTPNHLDFLLFSSFHFGLFFCFLFFFSSLVCGSDAQISSYNWCHDDHKNGDTDQNANFFLYFCFGAPANQFIFMMMRKFMCVCKYIKKKKNGNLIIQFGRENKSFLKHIKKQQNDTYFECFFFLYSGKNCNWMAVLDVVTTICKTQNRNVHTHSERGWKIVANWNSHELVASCQEAR